MDVKIDKKDMSVSILDKGKTIKKESITKDRYKELMLELSGERVDMLRTLTKLFKPTEYTYRDVR